MLRLSRAVDIVAVPLAGAALLVPAAARLSAAELNVLNMLIFGPIATVVAFAVPAATALLLFTSRNGCRSRAWASGLFMSLAVLSGLASLTGSFGCGCIPGTFAKPAWSFAISVMFFSILVYASSRKCFGCNVSRIFIADALLFSALQLLACVILAVSGDAIERQLSRSGISPAHRIV